MIPIYLDPAAVRIALVGRGERAVRRLQWLRAGGAAPDVWSDVPEAFGDAVLTPRLPTGAELGGYGAVWIVDLGDEAEAFADAIRAAGVLVNVEDERALCDFHTPAVVRRGKLVLSAGTGGASPAAARAAREKLEAAFPPNWEAALDELAEAREALRADGAGFDALIADARARLTRHGLI